MRCPVPGGEPSCKRATVRTSHEALAPRAQGDVPHLAALILMRPAVVQTHSRTLCIRTLFDNVHLS